MFPVGKKRLLLKDIGKVFELELEGVIFEAADEYNPCSIVDFIHIIN